MTDPTPEPLDPTGPEDAPAAPAERTVENLRIGVDTLKDGRHKAKVRSTWAPPRAITVDPSYAHAHADAATAVAGLIVGADLVRVERVSAGTNRDGEPASDWAVIVRDA